MSGPWDRPPSQQPDDEWPSEDLREPRDAWDRADPARDAAPSTSSGWDDWGSPAPPDAYLIEEPDLPTTDLWSESWGDEAAAPSAWTEPEPAVGPSEPRAPEPSAVPDTWSVEPPIVDAGTGSPFEPTAPLESERPPESAPEPEPEIARSEPHPEPWAYDVDPWAPEPAAPVSPVPPAPNDDVRASAPATGWADAFRPPASSPGAEPFPEPDFLAGAPEPAIPEVEAGGEPAVAEARDAAADAPELELEAAPSSSADAVAPADEGAPMVPDAEPAEPAVAPRRSWWGSGRASWLGGDRPEVEEEAPSDEAAAVPELDVETTADVATAPALAEAALDAEAIGEAEPSEPAIRPDADVAETVDLEPAKAEPADATAAETATTEPPAREPLDTPVAEPITTEPGEAKSPDAPVAEEPFVAADAEPPVDAAGADGTTPGPAEPGADATPAGAPEAAAEATPGIDSTVAASIEEAEESAASEPSASMEPVWTSEPWPPDISPAAPEPAIEPAARDFSSAAAALGLDIGLEPEPEPEPAAAAASPAPADAGWPEETEGTQVLPTGWRQPAPMPRARSGELEPEAGRVRTTFTQADADPDAGAGPTTAEQAVPWLIGVILLLAGLVIVLLALIFAGDASLGGEGLAPSGSPSADLPSPTTGAVAAATPTPRSAVSAAPSPSSAPSPTPLAIPEYGPLEMVYLGRSAPLAHIFLLRHDFTVQGEPEVLAQDPDLDVRSVAWSPDGTHGAGLYADLLISIEPGAEKRRLADGISAITFGPDPATLYAVRVTQDGANDVATVLAVDYATGGASEVTSVSYARPSLGTEDAVAEAQFIDDGGPIRLFWMDGGVLRLWILGGGVWEVPPAGGEATKRDVGIPLLWSSRSNRQIVVAEDGSTSTLTLLNGAGEAEATTSVEGLVSHLRWSPGGDRVVFTLGRTASGGGVLQDLFLWDLGDGVAPTQLTATGAAFSAEWLGATPLWRE